ncbi:dihydroxyacetone phosphate acyltransferase [Aplochiton taeniatus]
MASKALYVQRDPMLKKRDDFEDILEERRNSSDVKYGLKCYTPVLYKELTPCTAAELKNMVLHSDPLRYVINQVSKETGEACDVVKDEASAILEEMAHRLQLSTVRFFAFALCKAFKRLYRTVCINEEGLQRLQQAIQDHPVVLLPSHRSYMDFLLVSYLMYTYDMALPVIAAGMDFMGMKFIGEMLRMSGAFFIRRSFGGDKLYWVVFSEYVKTMLRNGFAPIEFFLEGTRSRTAKSLTPKLGLLNIVMEPFFKGEVFDVSLVPISVSYERVLEESLYARELLGVPKPKETTSGLLKARKVLSEDYGSIHVYFGPPQSVRTLSQDRLDRCQYNLKPRHIPGKPSEQTQALVSDVAYSLVRLQEENMVLRPWVLMASLLLQDLYQNLDRSPEQGLDLELLTEQTLWLRGLARQYGAFLDWPDSVSPSGAVSSSLSLHSGLVCVSGGRVRLAAGDLGAPGTAGPASAPTPEEELFARAVVVLSCASYRNQVLHVFLRPALVAAALHSAASTRKEEVFDSFNFLWNVFSNEFILVPGATLQDFEEDFEEACFLLVKTGDLYVSDQDLVVSESGKHTLSFLRSLLEPFLQGYQAGDSLSEKQFVPAVRSFAVRVLLTGSLRCYESLSSDLQKNALAALMRLDVVQKVKGGQGVTLSVDAVKVHSLADTLRGEVSAQKALHARL